MNTKRRFVWGLLNAIVMASMLLVACTGPAPTPAPTPVPPSPTPWPPIAPIVVDYLPQPGEELPPDGVVSVFFDQPMDTATVEQAFAIEPRVQGSFAWQDNNTAVSFKPAALERQKKYAVTVGAEARNRVNMNLSVPFKFTFTTVGFLEVSRVLPAPDTQDAETSSTITVMFNRPVVPLVVSGDQSSLPNPIEIDPAVDGTGEWLNTAIYIFRPAEPLGAGQTYSVRVKAGLTDTTGGTLKEDYAWSFTTLPPSILAFDVSDQYGNVMPANLALSPVISITFNQRMDHAATEAAFSVEDAAGRAVPGKFTWYYYPGGDESQAAGRNASGHAMAAPAKGGRPPHSETLGFRPDGLLQLDTTYKVSVTTAARALGGTPLDGELNTTFRTVPYPAIVSTSPADGDTRADPNSSLSIEFASPMDWTTILSHVNIEPAPTKVFTSAWNTSYYMGWDEQPSTAYTVRLTSGMRDVYGNETKEDLTVRFTTRRYNPEIHLQVEGRQVGTYNAYNPTRVWVSHLNVSRLELNLYRLSLPEFSRLVGSNNYAAWDTYTPSASDRIRSWSLPLDNTLNKRGLERVDLWDQGDGALESGLYYVTVEAPEIPKDPNAEGYWPPERQLFVVSRAHLTLKTGLREGMVWATDLLTGAPVPNAPVTLYEYDVNGGSPHAVAEGTTDAQGVWRAEYDVRTDLYQSMVATLGNDESGDFALTLSDWSTGIEAWDFNLQNQYWRQDTRGYLYTDRPIYRPGQVVHFKAAVRADDDAVYTLLSKHEVLARIFDPEYREVYSGTLTLSPYGTAYGDFELADATPLGYYEIRIELPPAAGGTVGLAAPVKGGQPTGEMFSVGFQVAEYRKPEFEVTTTPVKPQVLQGETVEVEVQATYYFGGPVADAQIQYDVFTSDYTYTWPGPGWYSFNDYDPSAGSEFGAYYDNLVASGTGRTDAQGRFTVSVPADLGDRVNSQTFSVNVGVTDITNQSVSGSSNVIVHRGDFYVGVGLQDYVGTINEKQTVNLLTAGWDYSPVGQQKLQVVFMEHDWNCALKEDESGETRWTCDVTDTPVYTTTTTTNESGKISVDYTPTKGGVYRIQASGRDAAGHTVSASGYQWIASGEFVNWRQNNNDRITLVTGQKDYRPGDTAEVLIPSPFEGPATALVTIERGRILQHDVITLESNSTIYRVPIQAEFTPNVYVSVVLVKGGSGDKPADYRAGLVELRVSNEQKQITLTLTPDKAQAGPRDTVTYEVRATDYAGRPVQAELSVGVIDLSVLALVGPNSAPILDTFYSTRGLGIRTATGLSVSVDRLNVKAADQARGKGGGGGGGEAGAMTVRQNFPDTAFWKADLTTDPDGFAKFSVTLPDSLTTWRLDARAISAATLVGQATVDVVATKPLLIRPVTPRFFVVGDLVTLAAVVNNNTTGQVQAEVTLTASGVDLGSPATQSVQVPAGGKVRVTWQATAQDVPSVDLTFGVTGGGMQDASKPPLGAPPQQLLPVYKYSTPDTVGTAGVLGSGETRLEVIGLPQRLDTTQGEVSISIAPSLAATSLDGLEYLEKYPYECIEQAISRFVPNAITYRALKTLNVKDAELEAKLPGLIAEGLQRLYAEQHADGGWGWFVNNESSTYFTAYALYGMTAAEAAGFTVAPNVKARAADFVRGALTAPRNVNTTYKANEQAWLLYVLAHAGQGDVARTTAWYEARQKMGIYARAYLALALHDLDQTDKRAQTILSDLVNNAVLTATGAHWEEPEVDGWAMNTDTRTTAIVLDALAAIDPKNELAPNVVRWLMIARQGDAWSTTQETAWAVIAFTDYMAATGELAADYTWGVALNFVEVGSGAANADTARTTTKLTVDIAKLLRDASNRLFFERTEGPGKLYYTAHLRAFLPVESVQPVSRGVTVQREYFRALTSLERKQCADSGGKDAVCTPQAITSAQVGDTIQVKLTLVVPHDLYYVYVEDPLPAGAEAIDTSLLTSSGSVEAPVLMPEGWDFYWGWWYFGQTQMRDEKTVLFAQQLPAGTYVYTYQMQATLAGQFHVMPTHASEFYFPETWGRSAGSLFTITEK